jgi:hypothetical protein
MSSNLPSFVPVPIEQLGGSPVSAEARDEAAWVKDQLAYLMLNYFSINKECSLYSAKTVLRLMAEGILQTDFPEKYAAEGQALIKAAQAIKNEGFDNLQIVENKNRTAAKNVDSFLIERALNYSSANFKAMAQCYEFQRAATIDRTIEELISFITEKQNLVASNGGQYPFLFNEVLETLQRTRAPSTSPEPLDSSPLTNRAVGLVSPTQ